MWYDIIVLRPSTFFCVTCDICVTVMYNVMLTPNPKLENRKINRKENRNEKGN